MPHASPSARRSPLLLLVLAVLLLATMAAMSYVVLTWGDVEEAYVQQEQQAKVATVTRLRLVRSSRSRRIPSGALVAEPRDLQDVRRMVEFCDSATAADVPALRVVALTARSPLAAGNAVRALARLHAFARDAELARLVDDPRERVRDETILAFGECRDLSALSLLERLVHSGDLHVRVLAVRAIGLVGGARARGILAQVEDDPAAAPELAAFAHAGLAAVRR